ncbi:DUF1295 domain-containing protein [Actinokineospora globicatena]|uniref:DUF1295 domain-containing protein n=1 Tax=Actinokineospora globicatena TaxID=103729 RepID=UPI0020A4198F|nr:DUF1295 domain-containing protein [Actinokineospora globicatena]MCP2304865.1 Steroid 5-alpha reductase family enzyme [Actinokineospora globicatena]GLW77754.1 membrane protein [Actinokineospora globicatena]GLW85577.1 membrane protein [Actinokineospora globicatena]
MILLVALAVVVVVVGATFVVSVRRGRWDLIDTVWGLGFAAIAVVACVVSTGDLAQRLTVTAMVVLWGVRLAAHIHRRNRGKPEDRRYVEILGNAKGDPRLHMLRRVFLPQAAIMWFVSLPVLAAEHGRVTALTYAGVAVWLVGLVFETVGDWQLARFKADPATKGTVLDTGLWRYTRHPNYFGDACVWWGVYLTACHSWLGAATLASPVLMTYLLAKGTGKPLTERHLSSSRPGYADYVARTSGFFPLPPKRGTRA